MPITIQNIRAEQNGSNRQSDARIIEESFKRHELIIVIFETSAICYPDMIAFRVTVFVHVDAAQHKCNNMNNFNSHCRLLYYSNLIDQ